MAMMRICAIEAAIQDLQSQVDAASARQREQVFSKNTSAPFSGRAFVAGHWTTGLGTKKWVYCYDTGLCEDKDEDPPNPCPYNMEPYEVAFTHGDIHITRW